MPKIKVFTGAFQTREEAIREIGEQGLWPYSLKAAAGSTYPSHHHKTDETLYLISGSLVFTEENDNREEHAVKPGDKLFIAAGQGHSVRAVNDTIYLMGLKDLLPLGGFPIWHEPKDRRKFFESLNRSFGEAEKEPEAGETFFRKVLAEKLKFRRAGGPEPIGKADFLRGVLSPDNETEEIHSSNIEVLDYSEDLVLVSLLVRLKGKRGGNFIDGTFRNTRVFVRDPAEWRCALWFNTPAETS